MDNSTLTTLYVPIDIGKNVNWYAGYSGAALAVVAAARKVRTDRSGYALMRDWLEAQLRAGQYAQIVVGHEPTGIYHEGWAYALAQDFGSRLDYRWLNPAAVKQRRVQLGNGRTRKSDPLDLRAIAHCLRDGLGERPVLHTAGAELRFQLWARAYQQTQREQRRLTNILLSQLDRLWPGALVNVKRFRTMHPTLEAPVPLVASQPLERALVRTIIQQAPNPYEWLERSPSEIQAFFRQHLGRCGPKTVARLTQLLQRALLPPPEVAALLAERLQLDFQRYLSLEAALAHLKQQAEALVPVSPAAVLLSVPGLSPFLAARYLAHIGHHRRFERAAHIWAFAGFDPIEAASGDGRWVWKISKKGDPAFRDTLYQIGLHTAQHCAPIARAKQRARDRGIAKVGATLHAAHKANRLCHHLLFYQEVFDPAYDR